LSRATTFATAKGEIQSSMGADLANRILQDGTKEMIRMLPEFNCARADAGPVVAAEAEAVAI
jgi:hypothetical protein